MRIKELSKEIGVENKKIVEYLKSQGLNYHHMSNIKDDEEKMVREYFSTGKTSIKVSAAATEEQPRQVSTIIRRGGRGQRSFIPSDEREKIQEQNLLQNLEPEPEPEEIPAEPQLPAQEIPQEETEQKPQSIPEVTPAPEEKSAQPDSNLTGEEPKTEIQPEREEQKLRVEEEVRRLAAEFEEENKILPEKGEPSLPQKEAPVFAEEEDEDDEDIRDFKGKHKKKKVVILESENPNNVSSASPQRYKQKKSPKNNDASSGFVVKFRMKGGDISQFMEDSNVVAAELRKKKRDKKRQKQQAVAAPPNPTKAIKKVLKLEDSVQVSELARRMGVKASQILSKLMIMGEMAGINDKISYDFAQLLAEEFGFTAENVSLSEETYIEVHESKPENLVPRAPVVTVMGHVDHGKTKLLDAIRHTNIVDREAGGITQHIGAYSVDVNGEKITFLDTPGHEAFTAMRSRGAQATDVVILIVAADDGVMPQTVEAINHAKAANVPIIVAINKIDKPAANPMKVKNELLKYGIIAEELGGEHLFVEISAKQRINIEGLLEAVLLQVEMMDLKADPTKPAEGIVIESKMDPGKGPIVTVLVKEGTLKIGNLIVAGASIGYVRSMMDWTGKRAKEASPSMAVEITGLNLVPPAGEKLYVFEDEKKAKGLVDLRLNKLREKKSEKVAVTLEDFFNKDKDEVQDLNVVVKGDVDGSVEAIIASLNKIEHKKMKIKIIHSGVGGINENDILLASASHGIIIGFNVRVDNKAKQLAASEMVDIKIFSIIYELIDSIKAAMSGMLAPIVKEEFIGKLDVREIFKVGKTGVIAGCMTTEGFVVKNSKIKLVRNNVVVYNGKLGTLKRFKDDVKEVRSGYECGVTIENYNDIKIGDAIECYVDKEFKDEVL